MAGGCALQETISYPDGYQEVRLLASDPTTGIWQLAIVDRDHGNMLFLEGHAAEGRLEFITTHQRGATILVDRVSFIERERGWLLRIESAPGYGEPWRLIQEVVYS